MTSNNNNNKKQQKEDFNTKMSKLTYCPKANNNLHNWVSIETSKEQAKKLQVSTVSPYQLNCYFCHKDYNEFLIEVKELYASNA